jgi:hypothetical protein
MTLSKRYDVCRLLGYDTVWSGTYAPTFGGTSASEGTSETLVHIFPTTQ